jgi:septal ring factor EnvC (AmiA/AmiB activator)
MFMQCVGACHQAMSLIRSQEKRIADLRKEADMMHSEYKTARARIAELKAALKPFADKADKAEGPFEPPYPVDYSLWRAARAAYLGEKE